MQQPTRNRQPFSETEDEFIRLNYGVMDTAEIAAQLGRTEISILSRAKMKGITSDGVKHGWANNFRDNNYMTRVRREEWCASKR